MSLGCFAQYDLEAMVAGLGGGVLLSAADDFTVGGDVLDALLTSAPPESACWSAVRSLLLTVHY